MDDYLSVKKDDKGVPENKDLPSKAQESKKRKADTEVIDVEALVAMDVTEAKSRFDGMVQLFGQFGSYFVGLVGDEKKKAIEREKILMAQIRELRADNLRLIGELSECERKFEEEIKGVVENAKMSAAMTVFEARLRMVEELEAGKSEDWDVEAWQESLDKLLIALGEGPSEKKVKRKKTEKKKKIEEKMEEKTPVPVESVGEGAGKEIGGEEEARKGEEGNLESGEKI